MTVITHCCFRNTDTTVNDEFLIIISSCHQKASKIAVKNSWSPNKISPPLPPHHVSCNLMHYDLSLLKDLFLQLGDSCQHFSLYPHNLFSLFSFRITCHDVLYWTQYCFPFCFPALEAITVRERRRRNSDSPGRWSSSSASSVLCLLSSVSMSHTFWNCESARWHQDSHNWDFDTSLLNVSFSAWL